MLGAPVGDAGVVGEAGEAGADVLGDVGTKVAARGVIAAGPVGDESESFDFSAGVSAPAGATGAGGRIESTPRASLDERSGSDAGRIGVEVITLLTGARWETGG